MDENKYISFRQNNTIRWDTAESERINFVDGNVRPVFQSGKSDEARTYQTEQQYDVIASDGKGGILFLRFAFIPPLKHVGFPAHCVKVLYMPKPFHVEKTSLVSPQSKAFSRRFESSNLSPCIFNGRYIYLNIYKIWYIE